MPRRGGGSDCKLKGPTQKDCLRPSREPEGPAYTLFRELLLMRRSTTLALFGITCLDYTFTDAAHD